MACTGAEGAEVCTECFDGYIVNFYNNTCMEICPENLNCKECNFKNECLTCKIGFVNKKKEENYKYPIKVIE